MRDLRQEVGRPELALPPQEDPQWRQTSQVSVLYEEIYPEVRTDHVEHSIISHFNIITHDVVNSSTTIILFYVVKTIELNPGTT